MKIQIWKIPNHRHSDRRSIKSNFRGYLAKTEKIKATEMLKMDIIIFLSLKNLSKFRIQSREKISIARIFFTPGFNNIHIRNMREKNRRYVVNYKKKKNYDRFNKQLRARFTKLRKMCIEFILSTILNRIHTLYFTVSFPQIIIASFGGLSRFLDSRRIISHHRGKMVKIFYGLRWPIKWQFVNLTRLEYDTYAHPKS